jgi:hypothetical protein
MLHEGQGKTLTNENVFRSAEIYRTWLVLVGNYILCELTYESDKFSAISGLATVFNYYLNDQYVAGLWRGDMIGGLLWEFYPFATEPTNSVDYLGMFTSTTLNPIICL